MGDGVTSTIQAGASILGGFERRRAMKEQAMAARYNEGIARLRARQVGAAGAEELNRTLSAIQVLRAGRGLSADSPTGAAIRRGQRQRSSDATNNAVLGELLRADALANQARSLNRAAPMAVVSGFADAAGSINSAFSAGRSGNFFGGGGG